MERRDRNSVEASRGCHLIFTHKVKDKNTKEYKTKLFALSPSQPQNWQTTYQNWVNSVREIWGDRLRIGANKDLQAEVFSPDTCSIYVVPYPDENPLDEKNKTWVFSEPVEDTRGEGMDLIYQRPYKGEPDVGGKAGNGGAYCSWVSIKRVNVPHPEIKDSLCQEVVCIFMGGISADNQIDLRAKF